MNSLKLELDRRPDLQKYLFCRGFLITDSKVDLSKYPFYGNWSIHEIGEYSVYVHNLQKITTYRYFIIIKLYPYHNLGLSYVLYDSLLHFPNLRQIQQYQLQKVLY